MNQTKKESVLITGINGFIGSELSSYLEREGFLVYGTTVSKKDTDDRIFFVDITKPSSFRNLPDTDVIIHLAAVRESFESPEKNEKMCNKVNGIGSLNVSLFAAKKKARHLVYISSNTVYGRTKKIVSENDAKHPSNNYGKSKLLGEKYCTDVCKKNNVGLTILRLSSVFGPNQKQFLVYNIITRLLSNKDVTIYGKGEGKWDFIYVKELSGVIHKVITKKVYGTFNIGSGKLISVKQLALLAKETFSESKSKIIYDESKQENKDNLLINSDLAKKKLGWKPRFGMKKALSDIKKEVEKIKENHESE